MYEHKSKKTYCVRTRSRFFAYLSLKLIHTCFTGIIKLLNTFRREHVDLALSIDIGGTNTKMALIAYGGNIIASDTVPTQQFHNESAFFQGLFLAIGNLLKQLKQDYQLLGIGIGAPSCNENEGIIENPANLPFSDRVEIVQIFERQYGLPTYLIKDSNAATLGEYLFGAAVGVPNFVLLTLGTGLGCGVMVNGQLAKGANGLAGELGHTMIEPNGRSCGCGKKGCLETYVSATALKRTVFELMATTLHKSILRKTSYERLSSKDIFDAAQQDDRIAIMAFEETGKVLGRKLADIVAYLEPELIILTGGLSKSGILLIKPTLRGMEENLLNMYKGRVRIRTSALGVNNAALLGAASLVWQGEKYQLKAESN